MVTILLIFLFFFLLPLAPVFAVWFDGKVVCITYTALYQAIAIKRNCEYRVFIRLPFRPFLPKVTTLMR